MNKLALSVLSCGILATASAVAGTMGEMRTMPSQSWVGTISLGPSWENAGRAQTFFLTPNIEKTYTANKSTHALFDGEIFLGMQAPFSEMAQGQLGFTVAATSAARLDGHIWDDANSLFDNYVYQYKIQHTYFGVEGKLLANEGDYWLTPWIKASVGVGLNHAYGYNNTPIIEEAVMNPNFTSHTQSAFSYAVGAGFQKAINEHWQAGIGYKFSDWGKSHLDRAPGQTLNQGLRLNHFYVNGLSFSLSYMA
jgi:opacity protein-like surface antigen